MPLDFKDLLAKHRPVIDPASVLMLRHTPPKQLRKEFPWLAADHPAVFNAYQQTQYQPVQDEMEHATYVASFIGLKEPPGAALFIGLYRRHGQHTMTADQIREVPQIQVLERHGLPHETEERLWFDLRLQEDFIGKWKGKLAIAWPRPFIGWHRFADRATFEITAIHEESLLNKGAPDDHREWDLTWDQLKVLPQSWWRKLDRWCGIYYIFDVTDRTGYVGQAAGETNLGGRWRYYRDSGHGDNVEMLKRDPSNFRFSILEVIPKEMKGKDVNWREHNWMKRLRSRTDGLNH